MTDLKPCPFCGVQPEVEHYETFDNDEWYIGCDCECGPCTKTHLTYEQAIAAWNARAERTCERVLYKPTGVLVCSECGAGMPKQLDKYCYLNYCPNCGSRVVE